MMQHYKQPHARRHRLPLASMDMDIRTGALVIVTLLALLLLAWAGGFS